MHTSPSCSDANSTIGGRILCSLFVAMGECYVVLRPDSLPARGSGLRGTRNGRRSCTRLRSQSRLARRPAQSSRRRCFVGRSGGRPGRTPGSAYTLPGPGQPLQPSLEPQLSHIALSLPYLMVTPSSSVQSTGRWSALPSSTRKTAYRRYLWAWLSIVRVIVVLLSNMLGFVKNRCEIGFSHHLTEVRTRLHERQINQQMCQNP